MRRTKFSNINLRIVLLCLLMLCGGSAVHADDGVVLLLTSGREVGFAFSSRPQVVPGEELVIRCADGVEVSYAYGEVQRISWGEVGATTSVDSPIVDGALVRVQFRVSPGELLVDGLPLGESVYLYRADGQLVNAHRQESEGATLRIPLSDSGLYIVRTSTGVSYKVLRP